MNKRQRKKAHRTSLRSFLRNYKQKELATKLGIPNDAVNMFSISQYHPTTCNCKRTPDWHRDGTARKPRAN